MHVLGVFVCGQFGGDVVDERLWVDMCCWYDESDDPLFEIGVWGVDYGCFVDGWMTE